MMENVLHNFNVNINSFGNLKFTILITSTHKERGKG